MLLFEVRNEINPVGCKYIKISRFQRLISAKNFRENSGNGCKINNFALALNYCLMIERPVRVRFAPSPTGPLHLGGVRTALYNYLFARKHNGQFLLRIEDTDQNRFVPGAEDYIVEALKWVGMDFDEGPGIEGPYGPYRQSERKEIYRQYADDLLEKGHAYYAFDTEEELTEMRERMNKAGGQVFKYDHITREYLKNALTLSADDVKSRLDAGAPYVIRMKIPRNEEVKLHDIIRGWVSVQSNQLDDKVLFKSDGMPTYHLANVVDDYLMKISHVIRGEEWLPSAPLHVLLYRYLGWEDVMPLFAHLPLILRPDGNGKLSKRDGDRLGFPVFPLNWTDPFIGEKASGYREAGYVPEAFVNILAMLGWHPSDNQELFTMDELIAAFTLERVSKSGAKFDPEKAKWYNHQYISKMSDADLAEIFMKELTGKGIETDPSYVEKICALIKEKSMFTTEFWKLAHFFFERPVSYDPDVIHKKWDALAPEFFATLKLRLEALDPFTHENVQQAYETLAAEKGIKPGQYLQLFRVLMLGESIGPGMWDTVMVLGKSEVTERLQLAMENISRKS
jgi:glutamyl-tRNA synthetase